MRVFLIAGEPSGDRLGGALMAGLRQLVPGIAFDGIGGPQMQAEGLVSRFAMDELSVMGLAEVLPRIAQLKRRIAETAQAVIETLPDVLITIDSPDFCLRVAWQVKAASSIRTVHYVAPSVWAWRPGRAAKMARVIDQVLALLPFEPPYMEAAGMACDFVGHPVVAEPQASADEIAAFRDRFGLADRPFLLALPGSRRGEVTRLAPVFGAALGELLRESPDLRLVVPAAGSVAGLVRAEVAGWPGDPVILDPAEHPEPEAQSWKRAAFRGAEAALAASGTVSLELAAAGTPMVVAYKLNWLTWQLARRMVRLETYTLVNLVSETRAVPECIGPECRPEVIVPRLRAVLAAPEAQAAAMRLTMQRLGQDGEPPGLRAARAVLARLPAG
ncbi:MAG: lipid-A-disaccharide synthase [Sedimentitalea sp.]|nr:lipid-A-disaccharide synthase [Sedimentitalea sp.]